MGTKNNPGKFDCYANAEPDEPMFILLARDKHAPTLVWLWAVMREIDGEDPTKVEEARTCVASMIEYQRATGRKVAGLGHAALCGVMELVRAANHAAATQPNAKTEADTFRLLLARTLFEGPGQHNDE